MMTMFLIMSCDKDEAPDKEVPSNKDIPQVVIDAFNAKYPGATNVKWAKKYNTYAVATFSLNEKRSVNSNQHTAWFEWSTGVWGMTETEMPLAMIPETVMNAFRNSIYAQAPWRVDDEVDYLQRQEGSEALYIISVEKKEAGKETEMELYFTETGILIKEIADVDNEHDYHEYLPQAPTDAIQAWIDNKYPGARLIDIERERTGTEVEFIHNGLKYEALFDNANQWLYTKTDYGRRDLEKEIPEIVMNTLKQHYDITNDWRIDGAEKIESATESYFHFEMEQRNSAWENEQEVYIKADGTLMNQRPELPGEGGNVPVEDDLNAFIQQKYPEATIIGKEYDDGLLEITIRHNNVIKEVKFNGRNEWIKTEYKFKNYQELPEAVKQTLDADKDFANSYLEDIEVTETPVRTVYEIEILSGRTEIQYLIDSQGKLISKTFDD